MKIADVKARAFAMPLTSPAFPPGPYRFINREYLIITYRTDREALEKVVPEPLSFDEPFVKYEFIRMPDSTGFGTLLIERSLQQGQGGHSRICYDPAGVICTISLPLSRSEPMLPRDHTSAEDGRIATDRSNS